jgi:hypothetical protein
VGECRLTRRLEELVLQFLLCGPEFRATWDTHRILMLRSLLQAYVLGSLFPVATTIHFLARK